jgi:hypothetical protein
MNVKSPIQWRVQENHRINGHKDHFPKPLCRISAEKAFSSEIPPLALDVQQLSA